jgi:signal recognition particle subunit SRP54
MTRRERATPALLNGSRRKRIAAGSGTSVEEVNRLLKQFTEMKKVLQMIGQGGMPKLPKGMKMPPGGLGGGSAPGGSPAGGLRSAPGGGKKRKKGGPWGLIKTR